MKVVIRQNTTGLYLRCGKGKNFEWEPAIELATQFDSIGEAALRAQRLGLDARTIGVEWVP